MTKWRFLMTCMAMLASTPALADDYYSVDFGNAKKGDHITVTSPAHKGGQPHSVSYLLSKTKRLTQLHADTTLCYHTEQKKPLTIIRKLDGLAKRGDEIRINANRCIKLGGVRAGLLNSIKSTADSILKTIKDPNLSVISAYTRTRDSESSDGEERVFYATATTHCGIYPHQYIEPKHYPVLSVPYSSNDKNQEVLLVSDSQGENILAKGVIYPSRVDFYDVDLSAEQEFYIITKDPALVSILTLTPTDIKSLRGIRSNVFSLPKELSYEHFWENELAYDFAILSGEFDETLTNTKRTQAGHSIVYALNNMHAMLDYLDDAEYQKQLQDFIQEYYHHRCTKNQ